MGDSKVEFFGRANGIRYTSEDGKIAIIHAGLLEGEYVKLKNITQWEEPYDNEEILLEEKQTILNDIASKINTAGEGYLKVKIDLSPEGNVVNCNEILDRLISFYNLRRLTRFNDMNIEFKRNFNNKFPYLFFEYCKLNDEEMKKFKEEISKSKKMQMLLFDFAKWKVGEGISELNQKMFTYGLYALELVLVDSTKEEVKEILKKYKEISKEKNLSFDEFMTKNRQLNELIKEIV